MLIRRPRLRSLGWARGPPPWAGSASARPKNRTTSTWSACAGCCRGSAGGNGVDTLARSSSDARQCACRASSGAVFGEDRPPIFLVSRLCSHILLIYFIQSRKYPSWRTTGSPAYLVLTPCSASTGRCRLPVLRDAVVMTIQDVTRRYVCHVGVCEFHRRRHRGQIWFVYVVYEKQVGRPLQVHVDIVSEESSILNPDGQAVLRRESKLLVGWL